MKKIVILLSILIGLSFSLIYSCKTSSVESSNPSWFWDNNTCDCNDMNCWNKKTNDGFKGSLKCAANAALLVTGLKVLDAFKNIAESSREITTTALSYDGNAPVLVSTVMAEVAKQSPSLKCSAATISNVTSILKVIASVLSISTSLSTTAFAEQIVENNTAGFFKNMSSLTKSSFTSAFECLTFLGKSANTPTMKFLAKATPAIKTITESILVPYVLIDCGLSLSKATITLFANSKCSIQDLKNLSASYDALHSQKSKIIENATISDCRDEPYTCNPTVMLNYGIKLYMDYKNNWSIFKGSLASRCYKACLDSSSKKDTCRQAVFDIYAKEPEGLFECNQVCNNDQCEEATNYCLSMCCNQESSCVKAAKKMKQ